MWNLRWQVNGFLSVCPDALSNVLTNRFVHGSDIHGANLKRAYVESSWEEQKEKLAGFLLVNVIALYESYLSCLHDQLASCNDTKSAFDLRKATENLQFPTDTANKKGGGIWNAIETIRTRESEMLKNAFYDGLLKNKKNSKANLDNLMHCYRYFKECRNALIHSGGRAGKNTKSAYDRFLSVASSLGLGETPCHFQIEEGEPVRLNLRGIVGFCDVVLRIIATVDAELSFTEPAEHIFKNRWIAVNGKGVSLPKREDSRKKKLNQLIVKLGLPPVDMPGEVERFLQRDGLIN